MIKRITIGDLRVTLSMHRLIKVIGVNSQLDDGRHILMWDFDDVSLDRVREALQKVQYRYFLSDIFILETKKETNYIAYCFTAKEWREVVEIIASTQLVDWGFIKWGIFRERFTLRVGAKEGRLPRIIAQLDGYELPNCEVADLNSWVRYETLRGG